MKSLPLAKGYKELHKTITKSFFRCTLLKQCQIKITKIHMHQSNRYNLFHNLPHLLFHSTLPEPHGFSEYSDQSIKNCNKYDQ